MRQYKMLMVLLATVEFLVLFWWKSVSLQIFYNCATCLTIKCSGEVCFHIYSVLCPSPVSFFVDSLSGTWWSGIIRSTYLSLSLWRKIQPSRSTGAGSVSSTARTARGCNTSATLWTSDLPERGREISREDVWSGLTLIRGLRAETPGLICICHI